MRHVLLREGARPPGEAPNSPAATTEASRASALAKPTGMAEVRRALPSGERSAVEIFAQSSPSLTAPEPGAVWPEDGYELLERLIGAPCQVYHRPFQEVRAGTRSATLVLRAEQWCLKTSRSRCFVRQHNAILALKRCAKDKTLLGDWRPPDTVLCVTKDSLGYWVWTVTPWWPTLRCLISAASDARDEGRLGDALEDFARLAVIALEKAYQEQVICDVRPQNFGQAGSRWVYIDDGIKHGFHLPQIGSELIARVEEHRNFPEAVARYVSKVCGLLNGRLSPAMRATLDLDATLRLVVPRSEMARDAIEAMKEALSTPRQRYKKRGS